MGNTLPAYRPSATVADNLEQYLRENGFERAGYDAPTTKVSFIGVTFPIPNTRDRQRAVRVHDLHHIATGFGTDLVGEGEISAWELGADGVRNLSPYVSSLVLSVFSLGCVLAPRRMKEAFAHGKKATHSLFGQFARYDELLAMPLSALREELALPPDGIATRPRQLHANAPTPGN